MSKTTDAIENRMEFLKCLKTIKNIYQFKLYVYQKKPKYLSQNKAIFRLTKAEQIHLQNISSRNSRSSSG